MPTLTPTKIDGATSKMVTPMTYVDPDALVTDDMLVKQISMKGVNVPFVADFLSAAVTHERCGVHLYRTVASRSLNPMLQRRYEEFGDETRRHVEILEELISSAGGNPMYASPMARAVEGMDSKLVESTFAVAGSADLMLREMVMLDAVFLAETVCHANWDAVAQLTAELPKGKVRTAFQRAVDEVQDQEDQHLEWARDTRAKLTLLQAQGSMMAKAGEKAEEVVARIKGWFS